MSYVSPPDFVGKMIDAGEAKSAMSTRDTLIRAYMAGAILALSAAFAVTVTVQTGNALLGAVLFPVGFCLLYLMGFDLLTGVFTLVPLALLDKRRGVTVRSMLRNWMVSTGVVAAMMSTSVSGKVVTMWMPVMLFFYMGFEYSVVNMFLLPSGRMLGGEFSVADYVVWNEIPTVLGNLVGGVTLVGLSLFATHARTGRSRMVVPTAVAERREEVPA